MFSLIITIISIALVAALSLATLYYLQYSGEQGMRKAHESSMINQASTIRSAVSLYQVDNGGALPPAGSASAALISGKYLSAWPTGDSVQWGVADGYAVTTTDATSCQSMNTKLGINSIPSCTDPAYADKVVCCQN